MIGLVIVSSLAAGAPWWQQLNVGKMAPDPDRVRASSLMRQGRSLSDVERAAELLEKALTRCEKDGKLCLETAVAYNAIMRIRTHCNTLHITKMLDTKENKKVWRRYGPRALELATVAKSARPNDPEALCAYADAYFFTNSVKGVLAAATTGSGLKFKGNAKELIHKCPKAESGVGHAYLGAFFLMAPWPLANAKKAEEHLTKAYEVAACRRNAYYLGVMHYRLGRPAEAAPFFRTAIKARDASASDADFGDWVKKEAQLALKVCEKEGRATAS